MEKNQIFFEAKAELTEKEIVFVLNLCEELFPAPNQAYIVRVKETKEHAVTSYLDKEILKAFNRNRYGIGYRSEYDKPSVLLTKTEGNGLISIPLIKEDEFHLSKKIALKLTEGLDLKGLSVAPVNFDSFLRTYRKNRRTRDFAGLYWLQYYDAEEFKKQGGPAILSNPYIDAQLVKDGIFIEVGKSPYDVHTPEGEELMTKANAAMPLVVKE
jgi:hypothetical protein